MPDLSRTADALTHRLGFERDDAEISRFGFRFAVRCSPDDREWRTWAWSMWAARIAVDQLGSKYDVSAERSAAAPRNIYEVPSPYGKRERTLLPRHVVDAVGRLSAPLVTDAWVDDRFAVVYGLEEGYGTHFLAEDELDRIPFDRANITENARLAHFYASYKARPVTSEKFGESSRVKHFHTVDGKTASRALLFPDFDWDAAQDSGCFFVPGRDHLVVGEPLAFEHAQDADQRAAAVAAAVEPQLPFYPTRYRLAAKSVTPVSDAWDDPWDMPPERLPVERLA